MYKYIFTLILPINKSKQLSILNLDTVYNKVNKSFLNFNALGSNG